MTADIITTSGQQSLKRRRQLWTRLTISITFVVALFIVSVFVGLFLRNAKLIEHQLLDRARAHFHSIVITRAWNAAYGGVFVEKTAGVESNPWLENPDMMTRDGRVFTLRNPAAMTRELSELAGESNLFSFRVTSDKPLNPENTPDTFETEALAMFAKGQQEHIAQVESAEHTKYRYAAPLMAEKSCLSCHAKQGYVIGDIRGTISVTYDVTEVKRAMRTDAMVIISLCIVSLALLFVAISFFIKRISRALDSAHQRISQLASTDDLTRLPNRRALFEGMESELLRSKRHSHCLSCIMIDLDHFKNVNDTYGHKAGDVVLRKVSDIISVVKRTSDLAARYGGEEMVVMLPETDCDGAITVAEKIRSNIEESAFDIGTNKPLHITISLGVACVCPAHLKAITTPDDLLKLADKALYEAKDGGRNTIRVNRDLSN